MVKRTTATLAVLVALIAISAAADAQTLQRLSLQSFDLAADATSPRVEVPFHLILTLRVRERVGQIDNINLPVLSQLELLGDERETTTGPQGTVYREIVTVVAHDAGSVTIAPATLQAIDAHDGKAKQWFSNGLTLRVTSAPSRALRNAAGAVGTGVLAVLRVLLWLLLSLIGIASIVVILRLIASRRPRTISVPEPPPPALSPQIVHRSPRELAADALTVLCAERTRAAAVTVRGAIWRMVGASDGETLGDVLRRTDSSNIPLRDLLIGLERSAFTYDRDLGAAIDDACLALERYIEASP